MCPFCLATAAWITVAAVSTGGVTALVLKKSVSANTANSFSTINPANVRSMKEDQNG
jgi:hypothetical protein